MSDPLSTTDERETCQKCYRKYPVWFAPNEIWNPLVTVKRSIGGLNPEMLCPICFMELDQSVVWKVEPEASPAPDGEAPAWDELGALLAEIEPWADATFPRELTDQKLEHLLEEIGELRSAPTDHEEWADCFSLLFDAARKQGLAPKQIVTAMRLKFEKNKTRTWDDGGEHGVYHHIEPTPEPPIPVYAGDGNIEYVDVATPQPTVPVRTAEEMAADHFPPGPNSTNLLARMECAAAIRAYAAQFQGEQLQRQVDEWATTIRETGHDGAREIVDAYKQLCGRVESTEAMKNHAIAALSEFLSNEAVLVLPNASSKQAFEKLDALLSKLKESV